MARVGPDVVLACEVLAPIIGQNLDKMKGPLPEKQRKMLIQNRLSEYIPTKLVYLDFRRTIPDERMPFIEKHVAKQFEKHRLKQMMKVAKVSSRRELEQKLHRLGTSLDWQKQTFLEQVLAGQWMREQIDFEQPITHEQMLKYYRRNQAEFHHPAKARWEQIMVRFSQYPSKADAYSALAKLGNLVKDGTPFAAVAKTGSDGPTVADGGRRNWTTKGSLVSETLDGAVFGLPVGRLSPIIEDRRGLHIIRVVEREAARLTPFTEVQEQIREEIRKSRVKQQQKEYLDRLRKETPIWTIYDNQSKRESLAKKPSETRRYPPRR